MKHVFIVNPAAGKSDRTESYRKLIDAAFVPRGLQYELLVSQAPGDCRKLAQQAAASGEEVRLYACGGAGTLNEVVNGVIGCPNAAVTHYPGGSGNDSIKVFSDTAPFFDLECLLDADETRFDLIRCNDTYCANILSIGDAVKAGIVGAEVPMYLVGVVTAAVVGYLCIRLLKFIAEKGRFGAFAYYCWAVGVLTLVLQGIK